ncbi:MAG: L,D-transpeptidase [Rhizobiaceae bacterium MnEN-MB40S]|nr:MAG: L,D-transpeptidase [Rhizobiaceae bacterium MnEN-MB40S]
MASLKAAYAAEPHEVRIVDRSKFDPRFLPTVVPSPFYDPAGTIVVVPEEKFLYLIEPDGMARRYGVAVGASGHAWSGAAEIARKAVWPVWRPTDDMRNDAPELPLRVDPGAHNPLGARALYLYQGGRDTLYRIHGTSEPWTIGTDASSGCIRMFNEDVIDLYERVETGAKVRVI